MYKLEYQYLFIVRTMLQRSRYYIYVTVDFLSEKNKRIKNLKEYYLVKTPHEQYTHGFCPH